jgi:hypothetical protein
MAIEINHTNIRYIMLNQALIETQAKFISPKEWGFDVHTENGQKCSAALTQKATDFLLEINNQNADSPEMEASFLSFIEFFGEFRNDDLGVEMDVTYLSQPHIYSFLFSSAKHVGFNSVLLSKVFRDRLC